MYHERCISDNNGDGTVWKWFIRLQNWLADVEKTENNLAKVQNLRKVLQDSRQAK